MPIKVKQVADGLFSDKSKNETIAVNKVAMNDNEIAVSLLTFSSLIRRLCLERANSQSRLIVSHVIYLFIYLFMYLFKIQ